MASAASTGRDEGFAAAQAWPLVWRGSVPSWECDENGHLNARFYLTYALEGMIELVAQCGMPTAFRADAEARVRVNGSQQRYLAEARVGTPLYVVGAVRELHETSALLGFVMFDGETQRAAASYLMDVECVTATGAPRAWPGEVQRSAAACTFADDIALTRGVSRMDPPYSPSSSSAAATSLEVTGRGVFKPSECDVFGVVRADAMLGRISDVSRLLTRRFHRVIEGAEPGRENVSTAALEGRLICHASPRAGDRYIAHGGMIESRPKSRRMAHWLLNPETGAPWATLESLEVNFDLASRKSFILTEEAQRALAELVAPLPFHA